MLKFKPSETHIVIGSGPAGISCAMALTRRNLKVLMIDVGRQLTHETKSLVEKLKNQMPNEWRKNDLEHFSQPVKASTSGVTQKLHFGSDYVFGGNDELHKVVFRNYGGNYSFATGGMSTVWGAAMLPVLDSEIDNWPIKYADLEPYYKQVLSYVPSISKTDALSTLFPSYNSAKLNNLLTGQGSALYEIFNKNRVSLSNSGLVGGAARLAVEPSGEKSEACKECGMCVYGCVYNSIYCSSHTLLELKKLSNFQYINNALVVSFEENETLVTLNIVDILNGKRSKIDGIQLYIACGALPTAKLVLESTQSFNKNVTLLDNKMALFPFFLFKSSSGLFSKSNFTLTQNFIELSKSSISKRMIHLQTYSYSDVIGKALSRIFPKCILNSRIFINIILKRMMIFQIFLHSDDSDESSIVLNKDVQGNSVLTVTGSASKNVLDKIMKINTYLFRKAFLIGGLVVPKYAMPGLSGNSYHVGGTFPMRDRPGPLQTNKDGLLYGYSRVRIVDASAFPSLPAATITFTIMANAYRIGSISPDA